MDDFKLEVFKNEKFGELEILIESGKEYFPSTEVAKVLGYKDPNKAVNTHCKKDGWVIRPVIDRLGRPQEKKFINEGNLYRLITKSKLPQAEQFENWIFEEILPTIRKTGMYMTDNVWDNLMNDPTKFGEMLIEYGKVREENKRLNKTIEEQTPKVEYTDKVLKSETLINISQIAKDFGLSGTKLNKILCEEGIQYKQGKQYNLYRDYVGMNLAKSYTIIDSNGNSHMRLKWTERGRKFITELLLDLGFRLIEGDI